MDVRWWYNFRNLVYRDFIDEEHIKNIWKRISKIEFVRLWTMCDPSSDWEHTIKIIEKIRPYINNIVVITKHWTKLSEEQMKKLEWICINTSISALDSPQKIEYRISMYRKLKAYCNSILRVNTCDFIDERLKKLQNFLLSQEKVIDNILRIPKNHELVINWIIKVEPIEFINWKSVYASVYNKNAYFWNCYDCPDKCGILTK